MSHALRNSQQCLPSEAYDTLYVSHSIAFLNVTVIVNFVIDRWIVLLMYGRFCII